MKWQKSAPKPRDEKAFDTIYGLHAVAAALGNPRRKFKRLLATENAIKRIGEDVPALPVSAEIMHPRHLDHMLQGEDAVHQGIILEAYPLQQPRLDQVPRDGMVVLLDQVTDPHNVGAILRSCAAFNVSALVSPARHSATANATLFKAASGAYEIVPMVSVTNLSRAIDELKTYDFQIIGLDSEADTSIADIAFQKPVALVLGAEGKGLRQLTRQSCHHMVKLPMPGAIKSLNVSIAAAISLYAITQNLK